MSNCITYVPIIHYSESSENRKRDFFFFGKAQRSKLIFNNMNIIVSKNVHFSIYFESKYRS